MPAISANSTAVSTAATRRRLATAKRMMIYTTMIATRWIALRAAEDGWKFPSADRAREPDRAIMRLGAGSLGVR